MNFKKTVIGVDLQNKLVQPKLSKTDEAFAKAGVEFVQGGDEVDIPELNNLFEQVSRAYHYTVF